LKAKLLIGLTIALAGCGGSVSEQKIRYTWLSEHRSFCFRDTITSLPKHSAKDSLWGRIEFDYCEGRHIVTGWTDEHYAPVDGGSFWFELDSLGKIYAQRTWTRTSWPDFGIVRSSSDSINDLIQMAIAASRRPGPYGLRYPMPPKPTKPTIETVNIKDEIYDTTETHPQ